MPVRRPRSTSARSTLALGALTAALVLSPLAAAGAQAAPTHVAADTITTSAAGTQVCYRYVFPSPPTHPGTIGVRVPYIC